jgi:hypothetical protein
MPGPVFPSRDLEFIQYCSLRAEPWLSSANQIGLTSAQATEFKQLAGDAQATFDAAQIAREAAKVATSNSRLAIRALRSAGSSNVRIIRGFAEQQPDPQKTYNIAQIPAPSPRTPSVPPEAPESMSARLNIETGTLTIRWKVTQPKALSGVVYRIERATGETGTWQQVGLVGGKSFEDLQVPTASSVRYRVIAQRGGLASNPSNPLEILFGTGPGFGKSGMRIAA